METRRVDWIDAARGIGIILIVLGHSPVSRSAIPFIYIFHVPLFFFLAGLVDKRPADFSIAGRARALLVPYFFFCLLELVIYALYEHDVNPNHATLSAVALGYAYSSVFLLKANGQYWFLPCLFLAQWLAHFFWRASDRRKVAALAILCSVAGWGWAYFKLTPFGGNLHWYRPPWSADVAIMAAAFVAAGQLARERAEWFTRQPLPALAVAAVACFALSGTCAALNGTFDTAGLIYGNYFLYTIGALAGIAGTLCVARLIARIRIIATIGRHTLVIFLLHINAFIILNLLFQAWYLSGRGVIPVHYSMLWGAVFTVFAICLTLPISVVLHRFAPWTVGRGSGLGRQVRASTH